MIVEKEEFKQHIIENMDKIYDAYVKASSNLSKSDKLLSVRAVLPKYTSSEQLITDEQKLKMIESLNKAQKNETIALTMGQVALQIAIKVLLL